MPASGFFGVGTVQAVMASGAALTLQAGGTAGALPTAGSVGATGFQSEFLSASRTAFFTTSVVNSCAQGGSRYSELFLDFTLIGGLALPTAGSQAEVTFFLYVTPPPASMPPCGNYTDAGLGGTIQPLMLKPDGTPNQDHFIFGLDSYPHPFPYSTNPPTSGPHNPIPVPWGIYSTPQGDETLVHNLEHGGVIINYQPTLSPAIVAQLKAIAKCYPDWVVMHPRPANDVPIALTSWGRLQKFTTFDEAAIRYFVEHNRRHGPECTT
jgi:uncharacterized protein DUF3105